MAYPTLANLKEHLSVAGTGEDGILTRCLSAAVRYVETATGRKWVAEMGDVLILAHMLALASETVVLPVDVWSLTATSQLVGDEGGVITAANLSLVGRPSRILSVRGALSVKHHATLKDVMIGASDVCPADIFGAVLDLAAHYYRMRDAGSLAQAGVAGEQAFAVMRGIPHHVADILRARTIFHGGAL